WRFDGGDQFLIEAGYDFVEDAVDAFDAPAQGKLVQAGRGRNLQLVAEHGFEHAVRQPGIGQVLKGDAAQREGYGAIHAETQRFGRRQPHAGDRSAALIDVVEIAGLDRLVLAGRHV